MKSHGETSYANGRGSTEYRIWAAMLQRCNNRNHHKYPIYGGRGIAVCLRWRKFENFLADMGRRPSPQHSLDRIDNDGDYKPGNVRWATPKQQARNKQRVLRTALDGVEMTLMEAAEKTGLSYDTVHHRYHRGIPLTRRLWGRS